MADSIDIDFRELNVLALSIAAVESRLPAAARAVVSKAALNIKQDTRENISDHPSWKRLASTVNYNLAGNAFHSEAVVGYDDAGQGELAGIYEFGSAHRAPHPPLYPAAAREVPNFEKALGEVAAKITEALL